MTSTLDFLLLDDDPFVRSALEQLLRSRRHRVRSLSTVADGLAEVDKRLPHLIIADLDLAPGDGFELLLAAAQRQS
jgi:DNA-binding response OmpR family regulator